MRQHCGEAKLRRAWLTDPVTPTSTSHSHLPSLCSRARIVCCPQLNRDLGGAIFSNVIEGSSPKAPSASFTSPRGAVGCAEQLPTAVARGL